MFKYWPSVLLIFIFSQPLMAHKNKKKSSSDLAAILAAGPVTEDDFTTSASENSKEVDLGRLLFNDKILSGNQNTSCATCHHVTLGTSDGLSLPIGEGGVGLGPSRDPGDGFSGILERVPRNSPALFNLGARAMTVLFHDGRVAQDYSQPKGFLSPAGSDLPEGLSGPLAVQALFPLTSGAEMAGQSGENSIGDAAAQGDVKAIWSLIINRLRDIPEYVQIFSETFDDVNAAEDMTITHVANAIATWESVTFRTKKTPFDLYLAGNTGALGKKQLKGMKVFYGKGKCSTCHSGKFQTDMDFHSIAMPQIGPGKGDGDQGFEDFGRERVTKDSKDRYKFRTPSLRNVTLTGPWGHSGAYSSLVGVIHHHMKPRRSLWKYDTSRAVLPKSVALNFEDYLCQKSRTCVRSIAQSNEIKGGINLSRKDLRNLVSFMVALTDPDHINMPEEVPSSVPSGLPVD